MYDTKIDLINPATSINASFLETIENGLDAAKFLISNQSTVEIEPLEPVRPVPLESGVVLGSILVSVGGIIWILTCYMIWRHSPAKKTVFWKAKG